MSTSWPGEREYCTGQEGSLALPAACVPALVAKSTTEASALDIGSARSNTSSEVLSKVPHRRALQTDRHAPESSVEAPAEVRHQRERERESITPIQP